MSLCSGRKHARREPSKTPPPKVPFLCVCVVSVSKNPPLLRRRLREGEPKTKGIFAPGLGSSFAARRKIKLLALPSTLPSLKFTDAPNVRYHRERKLPAACAAGSRARSLSKDCPRRPGKDLTLLRTQEPSAACGTHTQRIPNIAPAADVLHQLISNEISIRQTYSSGDFHKKCGHRENLSESFITYK